MGNIEKVSLRLSKKLGTRLNKTKEEIAVINYGMFVMLHTSLGVISTFIVGIMTGLALEMMIISITTAMFKRYSGGAHANSPERCMIIGIVLALVLGIVCSYITEIIDLKNLILFTALTLSVCYIVLYYKCPVPSKNKPLKKESTRKKLRKKAFTLINICVVLITLLIFIYNIYQFDIIKSIIVSIVLGMSLQMFVLTKLGSGLIILLDNILSNNAVSNNV